MPNLAQQLKKHRSIKNISQYELAKISGVNYNTLIKIETGQITNPTLSSVLGISKALDISLDDFVGIRDKHKYAFGQIFTSPTVAKLMVGMLTKHDIESDTILDPCIGNNIFLDNYASSCPNAKITGIELDSELISQKVTQFFKNNFRQLVRGDFFDYDVKNKFDRIIMNPPYVRQEELTGEINNKTRITHILKDLGIEISSKSNLYVYFILKALKHLKKNGKLVAIIYDSWLFNDFGSKFKEYISKDYTLSKIIHFEEKAFENVNVGATIIEIMNKPHTQPGLVDYIKMKTPFIESSNYETNYKKVNIFNISQYQDKNILNIDSDFFFRLSDLSSEPITRGTSAIVNKLFIKDEKQSDSMIPIIKEIKNIKKMSINNEVKYLFHPGQKLSQFEKNFIASIEQLVLANPDKFRNILNKIQKKTDWYRPRLINPGRIIFNYYFRSNIDYILNSNNYYSTDNFYNIYCHEESELIALSILNSSLTKISILSSSKPQGHGLRKIQLNKFKEVKVINWNKFDANVKKQLFHLGRKLSGVMRSKATSIIEDIDNLLLSEYNRYHNEQISSANLSSYLLNMYDKKL